MKKRLFSYILTTLLAWSGTSGLAESRDENTTSEGVGLESQAASDQGVIGTDLRQKRILEALIHSGRPENQIKRDINRKPAEILSFLGVEKGWKIADLAAGSGYYTRILSQIVGEDGAVYAINPPFVVERLSETHAELVTLGLQKDYRNVTVSAEKLTDLSVDQPLDAVMMALFYHDIYWLDYDRKAVNKTIYDALKPGGLYLVIDHDTQKGTGSDDTQTLHRVEGDVVMQDILATGFELVEVSDVLRNPDDLHGDIVFRSDIRGKTDRFVFLFKKPE